MLDENLIGPPELSRSRKRKRFSLQYKSVLFRNLCGDEWWRFVAVDAVWCYSKADDLINTRPVER